MGMMTTRGKKRISRGVSGHVRNAMLANGTSRISLVLQGFDAVMARRKSDTGCPSVRWFRRYLKRLLAMEQKSTGFWSVRLVNDREMVRLHGQTMNIPTPTDVLTFDFSDDTHTPGLLELDTVICLDVARRQAIKRGHNVENELLLYMVHSLLHVCGYNDLTRAEARIMHRREDEILVHLGVGAVYAASPAVTRRRGASRLKAAGGNKNSNRKKVAT